MSLKDKLKKPVKTPSDIINEAPADKEIEKTLVNPKRRKVDAAEEKQTERVAVYFTKNEIKELKKFCFDNDVKMAAFLREKALSTLKRSNAKAI
ncbi:MAG TPA: hypothetical protein PLT70_02135 [bacterium]|nr:hypothetical protein [bacterium]HQN73463.1 hypothetical protein [bacterium]